jgi:cation transport ATPase
VLERPQDQRMREHKYRCAQSLVFGLPVIGLQYFGRQLGGPESARWVTIMQVVLTGWILFIAATGMLSEGVMLIVSRRKITADFVVALIAIALFAISLFGARKFHVVVILLVVWSAIQWVRLSAGKSTTLRSGSEAGSEA